MPLELLELGAVGAPEMGCPERGDRAAPAAGTDGPQGVCTLTCARTPSCMHTPLVPAHPPTCTHTLARTTHTHVPRRCSPCTWCEGCRAREGAGGDRHPGAAPAPAGLAVGAGSWGAAGSRGLRPCLLSQGPPPRGPEPQLDGGVGAEAGPGSATPGWAAPRCPRLHPSSHARHRPAGCGRPASAGRSAPLCRKLQCSCKNSEGSFCFPLCPALG